MSRDINKTILLGNLGNDPQLRRMPNTGTPVTSASLYTNLRWKDKQGKVQEMTERHRIVVYDKQAEALCQYARKGTRLYIEGRAQTRKWTDPETRLEKETREIIVSDLSIEANGVRAPKPEGDNATAREGDGATQQSETETGAGRPF